MRNTDKFVLDLFFSSPPRYPLAPFGGPWGSHWPSFGVPLAVLEYLWDPFGAPWAALGRLLDLIENCTPKCVKFKVKTINI